MSLRYGLTIDPGMENGVCLFSWGDSEPLKIEHRWQFPGGAEALSKFLTMKKIQRTGGATAMMEHDGVVIVLDAIVVEKFTPRPHESFQLTLKSVEPLRGEGVLIGRSLEVAITWQEPAAQYFMGGKDLPDKKKRSRAFLKNYNLLPTGKEFARPDANDAISATLHAFAYLRHIKHLPTLRAYFPDTSFPSIAGINREETE